MEGVSNNREIGDEVTSSYIFPCPAKVHRKVGIGNENTGGNGRKVRDRCEQTIMSG